MKPYTLAIAISAAALLGGCASAGYNPNAKEPSWSKSMNSMGNDVSNSVSPEGIQHASDETNKAASSASQEVTPENAQKVSDETNKVGAKADSSIYNTPKSTTPAKKAPAKSGTAPKGK